MSDINETAKQPEGVAPLVNAEVDADPLELEEQNVQPDEEGGEPVRQLQIPTSSNQDEDEEDTGRNPGQRDHLKQDTGHKTSQ